MSRYRTKPGRHGTLYRYAIDYAPAPGERKFRWSCWAYDAEHAWDAWHDDGDTDWYDVSEPYRLKDD